MQLPLGIPRNGSNGLQITSLIYAEVSKRIFKGTGDVIRCRLYEGKVKKTKTKNFHCQVSLNNSGSKSALTVRTLTDGVNHSPRNKKMSRLVIILFIF